MISFKHCTLFISLMYATIASHPWSYIDQADVSCDLSNQVLDLVVLSDASCPMEQSQCIDQQLQTANTIAAIRGLQTKVLHGQTYPAVRVGFIEFGAVGTPPNVLIDLLTDPVNSASSMSAAESQREIYERIKNSSICKGNTTLPHRFGQANLIGAVHEAVNQFDNQNNIRDKKVLIFSNCPVGEAEQNAICTAYGDVLRGGVNGEDEGHNVIMVNTRLSTEWVELPQIQLDVNSYIDCLVSHDRNRIFMNNIWEIGSFDWKVLPSLSREICEVPTPAPTSDPTIDPTSYPSSNPTSKPTASPTDETMPPTTPEPSSSPSVPPTDLPTLRPSSSPTSDPITSTTESTSSTSTTSDTTQISVTSTTSTTSSTTTSTTSSTTTSSTTSSEDVAECSSHTHQVQCDAGSGCKWSYHFQKCEKLIIQAMPSTTSTSTTSQQTTDILTASTTSSKSAMNGTNNGPVSAPNGVHNPSDNGPSIWVFVAIGSGILCCCGLVAGLAIYCRKPTKHEGYGYVATDGGGEYLSENDASRSVNNQAVPAYRDEEVAAPAGDDNERQGLAQAPPQAQDY